MQFSLYIKFNKKLFKIIILLIQNTIQQNYTQNENNKYIILDNTDNINDFKNYICGKPISSSNFTEITFYEIQEGVLLGKENSCSYDKTNNNVNLIFSNFRTNNTVDITLNIFEEIQTFCGYNNGDIIKNVSFNISYITITNTTPISYEQDTTTFAIYQNNTLNADLTTITITDINGKGNLNVKNLKPNQNITSFEIQNIDQLLSDNNIIITAQYKDYCGQINTHNQQFEVQQGNILIINSNPNQLVNENVNYIVDSQFTYGLGFCDQEDSNCLQQVQQQQYDIQLQPNTKTLGLTTINGTLTIIDNTNYKININFTGQGNYSVLVQSSPYNVDKSYKIVEIQIPNNNKDLTALFDTAFLFKDNTNASINAIENGAVCTDSINTDDSLFTIINFDDCTKKRNSITTSDSFLQKVYYTQQSCLMYSFPTIELNYQINASNVDLEYDQVQDSLIITIRNITQQLLTVQLSQKQYRFNEEGSSEEYTQVLQNCNSNVLSQTTQQYNCSCSNFGGDSQIDITVFVNDSCSILKYKNIDKKLQLQIPQYTGWNQAFYTSLKKDTSKKDENNNIILNIANLKNNVMTKDYQYTVSSPYEKIYGKIVQIDDDIKIENWNSDSGNCDITTSENNQIQTITFSSDKNLTCLVIIEAVWGSSLYLTDIQQFTGMNFNENCNVTNTGYELKDQSSSVIDQQYYYLRCQDTYGKKIEGQKLKVGNENSQNYLQSSDVLKITYCSDQSGCYTGEKNDTKRHPQPWFDSARNLNNLQSLTPQQLIAYAKKLQQSNQDNYNVFIQFFKQDKINFPYYYEFINKVQDTQVRQDMYKYGCIYGIKSLINIQQNIDSYENIEKICKQAGNTKLLEKIFINTLRNTGISEQYSVQLSDNTRYWYGPNQVNFNGINIQLTQNQSLLVSQSYKMTYGILSYARSSSSNFITITMPKKNGKNCNIMSLTNMIDDNYIYKLFQSKKKYRNCQLLDKKQNTYQCQLQGEKNIIWNNYNTKFPTASYIFMGFSLIGFIVSIYAILVLIKQK